MTATIRRIALGLASAITLTAAQAGFELTGAKGAGPIELYSPTQRASTFDGCKDIFPGGRPIRGRLRKRKIKHYKGFPTSQAAPDRGGVRSTSPRNGIGSCTRARRLWRRDSEHKVRTGCTTNGH